MLNRFFTKSKDEREIQDMLNARPGGIVKVADPEDWYDCTCGTMAEPSGFSHNYAQVYRKTVQVLHGNCVNCGAPIDSHQCSYCKTVHS